MGCLIRSFDRVSILRKQKIAFTLPYKNIPNNQEEALTNKTLNEMINTWIQQSDLHFEFVAIVEEERLDGIPKISRTAIGEVKFEADSNEWGLALCNGRMTSFPTLEKSMQAVEFLSKEIQHS